MSAQLNWVHQAADIPARGLAETRVADAHERAAIAAELKLTDLQDLSAEYRVDPLAGGGYRLHGRLTARLVQPCVVSLEPVPDTIDERFDAEFWPQAREDAGEDEQTILDAREIEPMERGEIAAGRIVFETLAAALNPYPRKPGAEFQWQDNADAEPEKTGPFAGLARLKHNS